MMTKLREIKIGDLGMVVTGKTPPTKSSKFWNGKYPFITPKDISSDSYHVSTERFLSEEWKEKSPNYLLPVDSSCFVCIGATIGKVCLVHEPSFSNQQINSIIADESKHNRKYVFYLLKTLEKEVKSRAGGAATPIVNKSLFSDIDISVINKPKQDKVAEILSAYDNLIENNNRRIAILEDMAQSLYREWFVHFRFPGHEDCQFKDSELGRIPDGWEVKKLKEVCNLTMGQSPKSEYYNEEGNGMPFFQGVRDFGLRFPIQRVWCSKPTRFAFKDDILFSVRAPVGRINIAGFDLAIGRGLCAINHKQGFQSFLYQQLKAIFTSEDMMGNGAIFNSVTKADMEGINLLCPDKDTMKIAEDQLKPIFRNLDLLCSKNKNLEIQRDLLLQKLISGKINI